MAFICSICGEAATQICARCTKDVCGNHLCEKCLRCSDCCECEVVLRGPAPLPDPVVRSVVAAHTAPDVPSAGSQETELPRESDSGAVVPEMP